MTQGGAGEWRWRNSRGSRVGALQQVVSSRVVVQSAGGSLNNDVVVAAVAGAKPAISVIGLGYVGAVSMACLSHIGFRMVGVDVALEKVGFDVSVPLMSTSPIFTDANATRLSRSLINSILWSKLSMNDTEKKCHDRSFLSLSMIGIEYLCYLNND